MNATDSLRVKRDGLELPKDALERFAQAAAQGYWPDYQLAAMLMAITINGLTPRETATLTRAMADSGQCFDWSGLPGIKLDKHSTGGVGDKVSLVLAPLLAACGAIVPMMSGRGLGHTGGTLDKLEAIPGFQVVLPVEQVQRQLATIGCAMIGQSAAMAPADRKLYALRDVTATVESVPLITASILSKKLAEGISVLLMDVKVGRGAFMKTVAEARALAASIHSVGTANGLSVMTMLSGMDQPLGEMIGNALEVREALATLRGAGPADLRELCVEQACLLLHRAGLCSDLAAARLLAVQKLDDGSAWHRFQQLVAAQGGDATALEGHTRLPTAEKITPFLAPATGYIGLLDAFEIGMAAVELGAGRRRAEDAIDHAVGFKLGKKLGEPVLAGEPILFIHHRPKQDLANTLERLNRAIEIHQTPPSVAPLIREVLL